MREVRTVGTDYTGHKILCCPVCAHEWYDISGSTCDWCDLDEGLESHKAEDREAALQRSYLRAEQEGEV